ncbi:MAG: hypothetical protein KDD11_19525 [Acidobacteria bacterium]|nr:hypothetical protein [Acidobacteriota bacterium]
MTDVSTAAACSAFRSSSTSVITVSEDGLVTAIGSGIGFVTVTNEGATGVMRFLVSPGDPLTSVEGLVHRTDSTPVAAARVVLMEQSLATISTQTGLFEFNEVATLLAPTLTVTVRAGSSSGLIFGFAEGVVPNPGEITDMGVIVIDVVDPTDADADGVPDVLEPLLDFDPLNDDTDGDGTLDGGEDQDQDGLADYLELLLGADPLLADTDGDGILDGDEDQDQDNLTDVEEVALGTNPFAWDTDGDGFGDGVEVEAGSDPSDAASLPPALFGFVAGPSVAVVNAAHPAEGLGGFVGPPISLLNLATGGAAAGFAFGPTVSVYNAAATAGFELGDAFPNREPQ